MGRIQNEHRHEAFELFKKHNGNITNRAIAAQLNEDEKKIAVWKQRDKWLDKINVVQQKRSTTKKKSRGAPKGNKNAAGHGGPLGNKKAVVTGEFEAIWMDALEDDERDMVTQIKTDPLIQIDEVIALLGIRERRMMLRIQKLKDGLSEKQRKVLQELTTVKEAIPVHNEKTGKTQTLIHSNNVLGITRIEETEFRAIDDILRLEEALTRVQDKKLKALDVKAKLLLINGNIEEQKLRISKMKAELEKLEQHLELKPDKQRIEFEKEKLRLEEERLELAKEAARMRMF